MPVRSAEEAVGLVLLGRLELRNRESPDLPNAIERQFRARLRIAAKRTTWDGTRVGEPDERPRETLDGGFAHREGPQAGEAGLVAVTERVGRKSRMGSGEDVGLPARALVGTEAVGAAFLGRGLPASQDVAHDLSLEPGREPRSRS